MEKQHLNNASFSNYAHGISLHWFWSSFIPFRRFSSVFEFFRELELRTCVYSRFIKFMQNSHDLLISLHEVSERGREIRELAHMILLVWQAEFQDNLAGWKYRAELQFKCKGSLRQKFFLRRRDYCTQPPSATSWTVLYSKSTNLDAGFKYRFSERYLFFFLQLV